MNIIILGAGTFGTAIANELSFNSSNNVFLYSRNSKKVEEINTLNTNKICFPNKQLNKSLTATTSINDLSKADIVFIALPSNVIIENLTALKANFKKNVLLVNLSKGMMSNGVTIVDSIKSEIGFENIVTLKGPSFAVEVMEHADTLLTLGYDTQNQYELINSIVNETALHLDYTDDIRGVELLSVLKNIYALVIGVVDAKYNSPNTRFMILSKAFVEVKKILKIAGGDEATLFLACGFGDLCMTSLNDLSRNRTLGLLIGKGFFNADYKSNSVILEGLRAVDIIYDIIGNDEKKNLPIFNKIFNFFAQKKEDFVIDFNELVD